MRTLPRLGRHGLISAALIAFALFSFPAVAQAQAPVITALSAPRQTVSMGQNITLSVAATSNATISYQWKRNGRAIVGATSASLLISNSQPRGDGGWYQAIVTNSSGSTTSAPVFVNVVINAAQILAWGYNASGQLNVPGGTLAVAGLAVGGGHALVLRADGTVLAWGDGTYSQTVVPAGLNDVVAVAAGNQHSLALRSNGTVVAWGYNGLGQASVPAGLSDVVALGAGNYTSFAIKSDGSLVAWGSNAENVLNIPAGLTNVIAASGGFFQSIALTSGGAVVAWGDGIGTPPPSAAASGVVAIDSADHHSLALTLDGSVLAWGYNSSGETVVPVGLGNVTALAAGDNHSVVLKADGTVAAWGSNSVGQTVVPAGLDNVVLLGAGWYHTVVVRSTGNDAPPSIAVQPVDRAAVAGQSAALSVTASGAGPLSYQWRKGGAAISGATAATLNFSSVQTTDAGSFDVVVSNYLGSVTSSPATLTVQVPISVISTQPVSQVANFGSTVSFTISYSSVVAATLQWRKNGAPIANANSSTLTIGNVQTSDLGSYDVVVTNAGGSVTSTAATLSLPVSPVIGTQPANIVTNVPSNVTFSVGVANGLPVTYQWRKNGAPIAGATATTYSIWDALASDGGSYDVVVTNSAGSVVSAAATLSFRVLINNPPASRSVGAGGMTLFNVIATGTPPFTYQWQKDGTPIAGATYSIYSITAVGVGHAGSYTVTVTNTHGSETSPPSVLTVLPNPLGYSSRQFVGTAGVMGHFVIEGTAPKRVLLRALGPALATLGVAGAIADPQIELLSAMSQSLAANDNWGSITSVSLPAIFSQVGAPALSAGSKDAALYMTLNPGAYSVRISGGAGATGIALLELYDVDTNPLSRLAYVGVRGRVGAPLGAVVGGLTMTNSANKRLLLRSVSSVLGSAGMLANPQLQVLDGAFLQTANDDWGNATALSNVATQAGAFPLPNGSADAAVLVDTHIGTGVYTAQIPAAGGSGEVLLEFYDIVGSGSTVAPVFVVSPASQSVAGGTNVVLRGLATGTGPIVYQWRKNGIPVDGATAATLTFNSAQLADAGSYDIVATSSAGTAASGTAAFAVTPAGMSAAHSLMGAGYVAGSNITISNTLIFTGPAESLGWHVTLPPGWLLASSAGAEGDVKPATGSTGTLDWAWTNPPASPVNFTYNLFAPMGTTGTQVLSAVAIVRTAGGATQFSVQPEPLRIDPVATHSADTDLDGRIGLFELTRVIELYNTRNGTVRTGTYKVDPTGEDGFAPDPARATAAAATLDRYHSADTPLGSGGSAPDGRLNLTELTRVIELYNYRSGTVRTGQYHVQLGTEDGFAPGP